MKKFKLRHPKSKQYFKVIVYDSLKDLIKAANRHSKVTGENASYDDAVGVTHTFKRITIFSDGKEETSNWIGVIRLDKKHTSTQVVAHEVIHAAMHQYRLTTEEGIANFSDGCNDQEESFAHIYDLLFRDMTKKLYKHKIW